MAKRKLHVGIDLGTTNSVVAVMEDGHGAQPEVVENSEGSKLTASAVCIHSKKEIIVGNTARENMVLYPDRTKTEFKLLMGKEKVAMTVDGESYSPQQLSAFVLKRLVKDVEEAYDAKVADVTITVPARHGANERAALKEAAKLAGIQLRENETLDEPAAIVTAAAFSTNLDEQRVFCFDMGGGTTDCVVMYISKNTMTEEIIGGDENLGGQLYDKAFAKYIQDTYLAGEMLDLESRQELILKAEQAKQRLSLKNEVTFSISTNDGRKEITVKRDELRACTKFLDTRVEAVINDMKEQMKAKGITKLDKIILAGGSTRMPQIEELVKNAFSGVDIVSKDVDQAVAVGAAIYSKSLCEKKQRNVLQKFHGKGSEAQMETKELKRVSGKSYGIRAYTNDVLKISNMLFLNADLPAKRSKQFYTRSDNNKSVTLGVYESTSTKDIEELTNGTMIGEISLEIKGNLPKGSPITVELSLAEDGTLHIKGSEFTGKTEIEAYFKTEALLSEKEFQRQKKVVEPMMLLID